MKAIVAVLFLVFGLSKAQAAQITPSDLEGATCIGIEGNSDLSFSFVDLAKAKVGELTASVRQAVDETKFMVIYNLNGQNAALEVQDYTGSRFKAVINPIDNDATLKFECRKNGALVSMR